MSIEKAWGVLPELLSPFMEEVQFCHLIRSAEDAKCTFDFREGERKRRSVEVIDFHQ